MFVDIDRLDDCLDERGLDERGLDQDAMLVPAG